ncbi:DUF4376 domain-containing protein [Pseudomonas sp. DTU_2021_1001937_2_SI_NGA_ILE_001]|uniref:DUF4376 domain-containing protein n=1 Tax=Pseudomonas sp. DTU_2021_1001937_2_SI_NGA_ILE_001 TaxID=3077589 RepID=UPI0028FC2D3C|nr:DUF4376 domain-containing protein [Pseudomonas sp. DTU_2021_1001937_2_SI_NGA_ILE_001]WNW11242.1 DUF4376 domain-containing protein [Pseudomonas sp. DTU_2021_1001937_2_SI_NGA_ILE_001]
MVKVEDGVAKREPIPDFLQGLAPESLADLSWTDPALGVHGAAWWPEIDESGELGDGKKWGAETLSVDSGRKVVVVKRQQVNMTAAEKAERDAALAAEWLPLIAARRYQAETSGIELQGMQVATDDRSKLLINGAALRASREDGYTLRWKTDEGFVDLPGDQVLLMADAVADHVQACFDREAELLAAVADGSITAEMLERGWP